MKLKSLLLGSAAAMVVATGAQAADAIMAAQPEPVDYVRVCDAFGTGYFYIPGTETCLKIGGYVREDVSGGDLVGNSLGGEHHWHFRSRFSLQTNTNSNTELGVLHTYTETRFNYDNGVAPFDSTGDDGGTGVSLNFAYIELGGFRVGKTESEFTRLQFYGNGYAGGVIYDTLVGYGPFDAQQISYTYKNPNGFAAVIAVEDDNGGSNDSVTVGGVTYPDTNYIPDVLAGVAFNNGTWGAALIGAYDSSLEDGAIKARVDAKFGKLSLFLMGGYSTNGDETGTHGCTVSSFTSCGSNHFAVWGGDWAVWGGGSIDLTQKVSANLQLSYDDYEDFGAAGNLVFHVVPGFNVTTEIDYAKTGDKSIASGAANLDDWGGVIRFQRSF